MLTDLISKPQKSNFWCSVRIVRGEHKHLSTCFTGCFHPQWGVFLALCCFFLFACFYSSPFPSPPLQSIFPPKRTFLFWFLDFLKRTTDHSPCYSADLNTDFWGMLLRILKKCKIKPIKHSSLSLGPFKTELLESTHTAPKNNSETSLQSAHIFMSVLTLYLIIK